MEFTKRLSKISTSPTMAVMEEAQALKRQGVNVIDLGPGEPDFSTPAPIKQAGIEAIEGNFTKYTSAAGIMELREAVAESYNRNWGSDFSGANVVICCGGKHAVYNLCMTVFEAPHEVILPAPYWVTFPEVIKIAGALPRLVEALPKHDFELKTEAVRQALTPATKGLILNSPNNPSGAVLPEKTVDNLVDLCDRKNIFLAADETYEHFVYEGRRHISLAAKFSSPDTGFAIVGSMSKTYAMTGWRIGYCIGHQDLIKKISQFQSHQSGNPVSMSQKAALVAITGGSDMARSMLEEYAFRRKMVLEGLAQIPGIKCPKPYGAFYAFPDVSEAMKATGIETSQEFSKFLIQKAGVATVPGSAFGTEGFIRISYATSRENLQEALYRIKTAVHGATGEP